MAQVQVRQIHVPPGQRVELANISWAEFEAILVDLGVQRSSRVAYSNGILEIMSPLPEHERGKVYWGGFVKILLDELGLEWESLGSTTFKEQLAAAGLEPDGCFYIANARLVMGKNRLDLAIDPPPDLAIEIDVTSKTKLDAYRSLRVPEVWCHDKGQLKIKVFQDGDYVEVAESPTFPGWPLSEKIPEFMALGQQQVMSQVMRQFRQSVKERSA